MKHEATLFVLFVLLLALAAPAAAARQTTFGAVLRGENEVPPVETDALGRILLVDEMTQIRFRLKVLNIVEATSGHVHCGPVGVNGPVGVTLFVGGPFSGNITIGGTITAPDASKNCGWVDLGDVIAAMESGDAYVKCLYCRQSHWRDPGQVAALP